MAGAVINQEAPERSVAHKPVQAVIYFDIRTIDKQGQLGRVLEEFRAAQSEATQPLGSVQGPASFDDSPAARSAYYYWATFADAKSASGFVARSLAVLEKEGLPAVSVVTEPGQSLPGRTIGGTFRWIAQQKKPMGLVA